jgi:hypothetical protein
MYSSRNVDFIPDNILRMIIETIPDKVCAQPIIYLDKNKKNQLSQRKTQVLIDSVFKAWCNARVNGWVNVYVNDGEISIGWQSLLNAEMKKNVLIKPTFLFTGTSSYTGISYSVDPVKKVSNNHSTIQNPVINSSVYQAICVFNEATERLYLRLKNGNAMLTAMEGDGDVIQNKDLKEKISAQMEEQNKLIAPAGTSLTGLSVSIDGFDRALLPFYLNIATQAGVPHWMLDVELPNSSFMLEHREIELTRLFYRKCYPMLVAILHEWGFDDPIIEAPKYNSEKHLASIDLIRADIQYKEAASKRLDAQTSQTRLDVKLKPETHELEVLSAKKDIKLKGKPVINNNSNPSGSGSSSSGSSGGRML